MVLCVEKIYMSSIYSQSLLILTKVTWLIEYSLARLFKRLMHPFYHSTLFSNFSKFPIFFIHVYVALNMGVQWSRRGWVDIFLKKYFRRFFNISFKIARKWKFLKRCDKLIAQFTQWTKNTIKNRWMNLLTNNVKLIKFNSY